MVKKILLWAGYVLIVGLLVFGAANRTAAKSGQEPLIGNLNEAFTGRGEGVDRSGQAEGYDEYETNDHEEIIKKQDWVILSGQIVKVSSESLEIQTGSTGILEIEGRTWRYLQELGYVPGELNEVVVMGFYENGEFEVSSIQDLTAELAFQIRDEYGRPMWGGGRN